MNRYLLLCLLLCVLIFCSFDSKDLLNKPMPVLAEKTLDGKVIDAQYFKGHVTVVTFMFIGCFHCMDEISMLNKLKREYANEPKLQLLCISANSGEHLEQFNGDSSNVYALYRKARHTEQMTYSIQPACAVSTKQMEGNVMELGWECKAMEEVYGVKACPQTFFVDEHGVVKDIEPGGPSDAEDTVFYNALKVKVDGMLAR